MDQKATVIIGAVRNGGGEGREGREKGRGEGGAREVGDRVG